MDGFVDEIDSSLLLVLILMALTKEENDTVDEKKENDSVDEKLEDRLEDGVPEAVLLTEPVSYIHKSSNRKRLRPKTVYF